MSKEWEEVTLSSVSVGNKGSYGIAASAVEYSKELYTYLRITDITDDGILIKEGLKSVDDKNAEKYLLKPNDIVFARTGNSTGRSYFYDGKDGDLVFAGFLIKFSLNPKKINPRYMRYYTLSPEYKGWVESFKTGSTRGNINAQTYGSMKVKLPSREQQDFLVDILSTLDEKIEVNNQINKKLEEMEQAIFKHWFIDFEFPNENGEPYKSSGGEMVESELGMIPKGWEVVEFEKVFNFQEGPGIRNWQYVDKEGIKFINIRCIQNNDLKLDTANMISKEEAEGRYSHFMLDEWDIVVSTSGTLGRYAIVRKEHLPLCLNTSVIRFKPRISFNHFSFMLGYLTSNEFYEHLVTKATGSVQATFGPTHLKQISLVYPQNHIIEKYHKLAFSIINNSIQMKKENERLTNLRNILLPKLMSGEIRVPLEEGDVL